MWTAEDITTLKAAVASGVLSVEYSGPPARRITYQSLSEMRALLAEMVAHVDGSRRPYRLAQTKKGF
jgi:hypothetical protein